MSRKIAQEMHARKRFMERFGIDMTKSRYKRLVGQIKSKDSVFVCTDRTNGEREFHIVNYHNEGYMVVYDKKTKKIVTVFPGTKNLHKINHLDILDKL